MSNLLLKHLLNKTQECLLQNQSENQNENSKNAVFDMLAQLSNEDILHIMKPVTSKFILYKHRESEVVGWRQITNGTLEDESLEIIEYAQTLPEVLAMSSKYKEQRQP